MRSEKPTFARVEALTITLDHKWLDDVMSNQLKVRMSDPVADSGFGSGEEVIDNGDFVT